MLRIYLIIVYKKNNYGGAFIEKRQGI